LRLILSVPVSVCKESTHGSFEKHLLSAVVVALFCEVCNPFLVQLFFGLVGVVEQGLESRPVGFGLCQQDV